MFRGCEVRRGWCARGRGVGTGAPGWCWCWCWCWCWWWCWRCLGKIRSSRATGSSPRTLHLRPFGADGRSAPRPLLLSPGRPASAMSCFCHVLLLRAVPLPRAWLRRPSLIFPAAEEVICPVMRGEDQRTVRAHLASLTNSAFPCVICPVARGKDQRTPRRRAAQRGSKKGGGQQGRGQQRGEARLRSRPASNRATGSTSALQPGAIYRIARPQHQRSYSTSAATAPAQLQHQR